MTTKQDAFGEISKHCMGRVVQQIAAIQERDDLYALR